MIQIQSSASAGGCVLVGSDLRDPVAARREVEAWAEANGFEVPRNPRHLSVYDEGRLVREWIFVEPRRQRPSRPVGLRALFSRHRNEVAAPDRAA